MTTEQAKTKWCPMSRSSAMREGCPTGASSNSYDEAYDHPSCIADQCMMWRTAYREGIEDNGYCGLAGRDGHI